MNEQIPLFVISMKNANERRHFMKRQLDDLNIEFEFFDAVDGRDPKVLERYSDFIDHDWRNKRRGKPLQPGEIGCALSHALVYKKIVDRKLLHACILEDDAVVDESFAQLVKRETGIEEKESLVVLHAYPNQYALKDRQEAVGSLNGIEFKLYKPFERFFGTCGYYLTSQSAEYLYAAAVPVWTVADWPANIQNKLDAKGLEPPVVLQSVDFASQIQSFPDRKIPSRVRLMRLLVAPTIIRPDKYGTVWHSLYMWQALIRRLKLKFSARRVERI